MPTWFSESQEVRAALAGIESGHDDPLAALELSELDVTELDDRYCQIELVTDRMVQ